MLRKIFVSLLFPILASCSGEGGVSVDAPNIKNTAPTDIRLSNDSFPENHIGITVGQLISIDPDAQDTHTYQVSGKDEAHFIIEQNSLSLAQNYAANFEQKNEYEIQITSNDRASNSLTKDFVIKVLDRNDLPTASIPTNISTKENTIAALLRFQGFDEDQAAPSDLIYEVSGVDRSSFYLADLPFCTAGITCGESLSPGKALVFQDIPDFEGPRDQNQDNIYEIQISISDNSDAMTYPIRISVENIEGEISRNLKAELTTQFEGIKFSGQGVKIYDFTFSNTEFLPVHFNKTGEGYIALFYNVIDNIPGGRSLDYRYYGLDIFFIDKNGPVFKGRLFENSSFESIIKTAEINDDIIICASKECILFDSLGNIKYEIDLESSGLTGLVVADIRVEQSILLTLKSVREDEALWLIKNQEIYFKEYSLAPDLRITSDARMVGEPILAPTSLLLSSSIPLSGLDNREGRIVWGSYYLIKGLLNKYRETNQPYYLDVVRLFLSRWETSDVENLLLSQRYSFSREQQLFLLHVSRYFNLLKDLENDIDLENEFPRVYSSIEELKLFLIKPNGLTVEIFQEYDFDSFGVMDYVAFREESDFWANGINVPVNYVSDYIIALSNINSPESLEMAGKLLQANNTFLESLALPSWRYWYGDGLRGWSNSQVNVSDYVGQEANEYAADIFYRTTDAEAFIVYCRSEEASREFLDCEAVLNRIADYTERGNLLPYLNHYFNIELSGYQASLFSPLVYIGDFVNPR